jgi:hypothetical protein
MSVADFVDAIVKSKTLLRPRQATKDKAAVQYSQTSAWRQFDHWEM